MNLTICYITSRLEPKIEWFLDSLDLQDPQRQIKVAVIDFYAKERPDLWLEKYSPRIIRHLPPKPCVWQGEHRLTKEDWFAVSNCRNTALCVCPDGWIAYVDDVSVLVPGWLDRVRAAHAEDRMVFGAYKKVNNLQIENGNIINYRDYSVDSRLGNCGGKMVYCDGSWLYGCSLAGPVEAFLKVNGWPEDLCDGMGFEDVLMGIAMYNSDQKMSYDPGMMTLESEEHHHGGKVFKRSDYGQSPNDKSHAALSIARSSSTFPNSFGDGGIRALRQSILAGGEFPIKKHPEHEWFTSTPISEL